MKIIAIANVPDELGHAWLQHLRDFDVAHPGCHFEAMADAPDMPIADVVKLLTLNPALDNLRTVGAGRPTKHDYVRAAIAAASGHAAFLMGGGTIGDGTAIRSLVKAFAQALADARSGIEPAADLAEAPEVVALVEDTMRSLQ